jgi:hypothetical protein
VTDSDKVDAAQCREHFCPKRLRKYRPSRALVYEPVASDGYNKDVSESSRGFQMSHMPKVQEVEGTVSLYDFLSGPSVFLSQLPQLFYSVDFVAWTQC